MAIATKTRCTTTEYAEQVTSGAIVAGPNVRLACKRHLQDLKTGSKRGLRFDEEAAEKAIKFFGFLCLAEGEFAGQPFNLQLWQQFIVGSLFGWKSEDGYRRFRKAYVEIGKGNGKSPMAAGIGLYGLMADGEDGAQIYAAAVTRDQAGIMFTDAKSMVKASPALSRRIDVNIANLSFPAGGSYFRPVSSEGRSLDGKRVHMALIDELHEHPTNIVVEKMQAGTKGRRQPLIFEITNSGVDRESVCYQHHVYSEQVLSGTLEDDGWFGYICGLDEKDDWKDESVWIKANPNIGISITWKYLREQVKEAIGMPSKENIVKRLNFCIWTQQIRVWIPPELWAENAGVPIDEDDLAGRRCYGGLDLAAVSDINAWVMLFPRDDGSGILDILARFWCPEARLYDPQNRYAAQYQAWANSGHLVALSGNAVDDSYIIKQVADDAEKFQLIDMNIDRLFNGKNVQIALMNEGIEVFPMGQGFLSMSQPMKEFEKRLLDKKLHHGNNPVLNFMAHNVAVQEDAAGNKKPDKANSQGKIDGIVALVMALDRASRGDTGTSMYETQGLDYI